MLAAELYRALATFSFTAQSGRINERDLLIAVPAGHYLVEIQEPSGVAGEQRIHLELPLIRPRPGDQQPAPLQ